MLLGQSIKSQVAMDLSAPERDWAAQEVNLSEPADMLHAAIKMKSRVEN